MNLYIFLNHTNDNKGKLGLKYLTNKILIYIITNKKLDENETLIC